MNVAKSSETRVQTEQADLNIDQLIERVAHQQDVKAFTELYQFFVPRLKSFLTDNYTSPEAAEDLAQEVLRTIWIKAPQFDRSKAQATTWVYTIARNKKIDVQRKNRRSMDMDDDTLWHIADNAPEQSDGRKAFDLEAQQSDIEQGEKLKNAIAQLPEKQKSLIERAFYEDLSHHEIAEQEQLPLGTVKSRLRLGLVRLREILNEDEF